MVSDYRPVSLLADVTSYAVARCLFDTGYPVKAVRAVLAEADRFPEMWAYTSDRRRCVVKHMPSGLFEVQDCAESEARIKALRRGAHDDNATGAGAGPAGQGQ